MGGAFTGWWCQGFYHKTTGCITGEYETVCRELSFKPWAGTNSRIGARAQPPDIADVLLHETAIADLRALIFKSTPVKPWEETAERFAARLQEAVDHANAEHRLADLCRQMPQRLDDLVRTHKGDRLPKRNFILIIRCAILEKS